MSAPHSPWPRLNAWLDDRTVTDICLNGATSAFTDRGQGMEAGRLEGVTEESLKAWVLDQLARCGRTWDARHPFADAVVKSSHHRLHVCFPPIAGEGMLISLRRLPNPAGAPEDAREAGARRWGGSPHWALLRDAVASGDSLLISGSTGSGKTTLLNDLLAHVPPGERVVALEDTPELGPAHPHFLSLLARPANADGFGEVSLRQLLKQSLRMRPDRIVLGECRGEEFLDLLQALNTGHRGAAATLHAQSPRDALRRAELICLLAGGGRLSSPALRELLAVGVQWVAQVERGPEGRRISAVCRVEGREGDTILLRDMRELASWTRSPTR